MRKRLWFLALLALSAVVMQAQTPVNIRQVGDQAVSSPLPVSLAASSTGGATPYSWLSDGSTTSLTVKASAGNLTDIQIVNANATTVYVRAYDGTPTCTSATGIVARWIIPANGASLGGGISISLPAGKVFASTIGLCATATVSDTNNTAVGSATVTISAGYK